MEWYKSRPWVLFKAFVFSVVPLALTIVFMVVMGKNNDKAYCYVRHSYRQDFLATFATNPYYSSTHLLRRAPPSKIEVAMNLSMPPDPRMSDIQAFPVVMENTYVDAAFWPVQVEHDFSVVLAAISASPKGQKEHIFKEWNEIMAHDNSSHIVPDDWALLHQQWALWEIPGLEQHLRQATYHLLPNGLVVYPFAYAPWATTRILTALYNQRNSATSMANALAAGSIVGVLPNLHRYADDTDEAKWVKEIGEFYNSSQLRGQCMLAAQQPTVEISSNSRVSIELFSSINAAFMSIIIVWIHTSFAIYQHLPGAKEQWQWMHAIFYLFNALGFLAVFVILVVQYDTWNIPGNNIFIALIAIVATMVVQWMWGSKFVTADRYGLMQIFNLTNQQLAYGRNNNMPMMKGIGTAGGTMQQRVPHHATNNPYMPMAAPMNSSSMAMMEKGMNRFPGMSSIPLGQPYQERGSDSLQEEDEHEMVYLLECSIVVPLLVVSVLVSVSPSITTPMVQLCYATALSFFILCISLHRVAATASATEKAFKSDFQHAGLVLLFGSFVPFVLTYIIFFHYTLNSFDAVYNIAGEMRSLVIISMMLLAALLLIIVTSSIHRMNSTKQVGDGMKEIIGLMYAGILLAGIAACTVILVLSSTAHRLPYGCDVWAYLT